jgi:hypothetical protein
MSHHLVLGTLIAESASRIRMSVGVPSVGSKVQLLVSVTPFAYQLINSVPTAQEDNQKMTEISGPNHGVRLE